MKKRLLALALAALLLTGCGSAAQEAAPSAEPASEPPAAVHRMKLDYAEQFSVTYRPDGCARIDVEGAGSWLLVPPDKEPSGDDGLLVLRQPLQNLYIAASSAMDHFVQLAALDRVRLTSTSAENWGLPEVREAMDREELLYAGKYSAPDFELALEEHCSLAVESTMIYHSPEIKEQLEGLGIPVLVERSSYEPHPLGRVEWIKLYGLLLGKDAEAEEFFSAQKAKLESLSPLPSDGPSAAFFHISTAGAAVVRKPGDYVSKMISLAGGRYVFDDLPGADDASLSTMNMQMESFYAGAKDADALIYNSTIDGELDSLSCLLEKSALLADFKAVRSGNVWCTEHDMFQKSSAAAGIIADLNTIFTQGADAPDTLEFFHKLK